MLGGIKLEASTKTKMKNYFQNLLLLLGLLLLVNCSTQKINSEHFNREWMLIEFQGFTKDLMIKNRAKLDLSQTTDTNKKFTANMGCNNFFGQIIFKRNGKVTFSQMGSTEMFCEQNMDLETVFMQILPTVTSYQITGHHLTLTTQKGEILKFIAADWD